MSLEDVAAPGDYLTGKAKASPRHEFMYVNDDGQIVAIRYDAWKAVFLENRGKVLSIDELLKRVRGPDVFLTDRVVYTHVNNLRSKIEEDPADPVHLVTVRGFGYRLKP